MENIINMLNKNIKREEAKKAFVCECKEVLDRIDRNIEWNKSRLTDTDGNINDYYERELADETERREIYETVFKEICEKIIEL